MTATEKATALGAYLAALGVSTSATAFCLPILTGERPVPTAVESALAETSATVADGVTVNYCEAAKRKGVSRSTIYRLVKDGTLPIVNLRGKPRIRLGDLERAFAPSPSAN